MLNGVCFTENQGKDLIRALVQGVIMIEESEPTEEKIAVNALFDKENVEMIANEKLFYYGLLDKIDGTKISFKSKSRIYHTIANIKKALKTDKSWKN